MCVRERIRRSVGTWGLLGKGLCVCEGEDKEECWNLGVVGKGLVCV